MTDKIIWTGTNDDFSAVVGEYELDACASSKGYDWALFKSENLLGCYYHDLKIRGNTPTLDEAKAAAEQAYINHINK